MAVPDFQSLMRPLLALHEDGEVHEIGASREMLASELGLTEQDRLERIPSGRVTLLQNRLGWAATYLFRAGLLERPQRAHYRITDRGREMLAAHPKRIDLSVLGQFAEYQEFRQLSHGADAATPTPSAPEPRPANGGETAEERLNAGYQELRSSLAANLLDRVREGSWEFFERLVLDVLAKMGYGGPEGSIERLGGHGSDDGVDGVIREDRLGLDLIYVQAKSWQGTVGRPEIQRFFGALHGKRANKGVFITTSKFSSEAREYAQGVSPRVILVDGAQLAQLMIDAGVGVTRREVLEIKRIDLDYFASDEDVEA